MNTAPDTMTVLVGEKFACIRIAGRASFSSSVDFRTLLDELCLKGYSLFVLDLSQCKLMDSTFLGVLAGFGLKLNPTRQPGCQAAIELLNPNPRITALLEDLGILHLFKVSQGPLALPDSAQHCPVAPSHPSKEQVTRSSLEAHQVLMQINPANIPKFKDVAAFLAEDLKKLHGG